jgi:hypothetical protein
MDELDEIFHVSETDGSGSDDRPMKPKPRSKRPGGTRPGSPRGIATGYEDSEEALDDLRDRFEEKYGRFQQDLDDLKHEHSEKLAVLKHNNLTQEQARAASYTSEYQNLVWSVTLKHVGCGMLTEDLGNVLQHQLSEEQFKFEKDILELQQQFDEELAQARQEKPEDASARRRRRRRLVRTLDPKRMAAVICQGLADAEDTLTSDPSTEVIDGLITTLRRESQRLASRRPASPPHRRQPPNPRARRPPPPPPPPRPEDAGGTANLQKHIRARTKLEKTIAQADRFVQDLHEQARL